MKYEIRFKKRGEVTDKQKAGILKKLKLKIMKEKDKGPIELWIVKAKDKLTEESMARVLKFYKVTKEMSNLSITER